MANIPLTGGAYHLDRDGRTVVLRVELKHMTEHDAIETHTVIADALLDGVGVTITKTGIQIDQPKIGDDPYGR